MRLGRRLLGGWYSRGRRRRRGFLALVGASVAAMLGMGTLVIGPEYVLFRDRELFSIFDLDQKIAVQAFDHHTHDGLILRSWYILPRERPTIVYFAGRDGDLTRKPGHLLQLTEEGYGLILVGYRGYGGNPGWPNESSMFLDSASLLWQAERAGLSPHGFVFYGYSMGTAFASNAAVQARPLAVVLEAPISTFGDAVRQQVANYPRWLVRTHFDNLARAAELDVPTLMLAGGRDTVTPPTFALALAAARDRAITLEIIEEANHVNIIRLGGRQVVRSFLEELEIRTRAAEDNPALDS